MSNLALSPGVAALFYPERREPRESGLDRFLLSLWGQATRRWRARPDRFQDLVVRVNEKGRYLEDCSDLQLQEEQARLRRQLRSRGFAAELVAQGFALVREYARRLLGLRHYDVQVLGGWVLLHGMVAEMETGEGKTLTATLPAAIAAMAGIPVHVVTVNDYLAQRDAAWMQPIYEALGLTVGVVTSGLCLRERQQAYRCHITYCTNKELVFDYLKDRLAMGRRPGRIQAGLARLAGTDSWLARLCLPGLFYAIVDEADSVLIDEARTPLIIAGPGTPAFEAKVYQQALELARQLTPGRDFTLESFKKALELTPAGEDRLEELTRHLEGLWSRKTLREELVRQALVALHLFVRDRDYLVQDRKVQIVDEFTGRLMADRHWERGLHQLIEAKEGCEITTPNETLARISYQRFFRRYLHLAGMTGTAREVANELWDVYRLRVVRIPTHRPLRRQAWPLQVYATAAEKWQKIVARVEDLHREGRPVLVGTRSVAASEYVSDLLTQRNLPHRVLNARQDRQEAEIIAQAGQRGQITVATNMAGRGTDILLGPGVKELGGLHVIATEPHEARRIDRQLFGRCGRQGDPGTYEGFASLEDEILAAFLASPWGWPARFLLRLKPGLLPGIGSFLVTLAQILAERRHFQMRRQLLKFEESLDEAMAFSGRIE